jgi:hypothetical protein
VRGTGGGVTASTQGPHSRPSRLGAQVERRHTRRTPIQPANSHTLAAKKAAAPRQACDGNTSSDVDRRRTKSRAPAPRPLYSPTFTHATRVPSSGGAHTGGGGGKVRDTRCPTT